MKDIKTNRCTKCGKPKPLSEFYIYDGKVKAECKQCTIVRVMKYQAKNLDKRYRWSQVYYQKNKDLVKAKNRAIKQKRKNNYQCPACSAPLSQEEIKAKYIKCQNCREGIHKPHKPIFAKQLREVFLK